MGRVSGGAGVSTSTLARLKVLPDRRLAHRITALGDSRVAAIHLDPAHRVLGNRSPLNWAIARMGAGMTLAPVFGQSGDRTDQMAARLPAAIATDAGLLYLQGGLNDIAQRYPSAAQSGASAAANLIAIADAARDAGMIVVIELEVGSNDLDVGQIAQVVELNAALVSYAAVTPGIHLNDARFAVLDPATDGGTIRYRPLHAYDGMHPNGRGAYAWSDTLVALLTRILPPALSPLVRHPTELPQNGRRQLLANPLLLAATGGFGGSGGPVPAGFVVEELVGTATLSSRATPEGSGNEAVIEANFTGPDQRIIFKQDAQAAHYAAGDVVEAVAEVELLDPPTGLAGLYLNLNQWTGSEGFDTTALAPADAEGPERPGTITLRTRAFTIRPHTGGWLAVMVVAQSGAAGSARFAVRQVGLRRIG